MADYGFKFDIGQLVVLRTERVYADRPERCKEIEDAATRALEGIADKGGAALAAALLGGGSVTAAVPREEGPRPFVVVERTLQECHGGVQRFYRVRTWGRDGRCSLGDLTSLELEPYEPESQAG